jgi:hypothetical protein
MSDYAKALNNSNRRAALLSNKSISEESIVARLRVE